MLIFTLYFQEKKTWKIFIIFLRSSCGSLWLPFYFQETTKYFLVPFYFSLVVCFIASWMNFENHYKISHSFLLFILIAFFRKNKNTKNISYCLYLLFLWCFPSMFDKCFKKRPTRFLFIHPYGFYWILIFIFFWVSLAFTWLFVAFTSSFVVSFFFLFKLHDFV